MVCFEVKHQLGQPKNCIEGQQSDRSLVANSYKTSNLNPNHNFIPCIIIDEKHTDQMQKEGQRNLIKYLCNNHFMKRTDRQTFYMNASLGDTRYSKIFKLKTCFHKIFSVHF